ncbi:hypothetical protein [Sphingomonas xinjiangensis]|uniref:Dolichyl-phosphate-mannose-protein mannosyltransferase n=1 Tax=Sphingomonas xinjiangensis TaxID=643568 RepID=A0A840YLS9_9SPHN|nr:hypothetical protein [Sphingomonas xinjiangensis]MBB5710506.1 hypothetical protein [Sphingomonas xinjiangensis]
MARTAPRWLAAPTRFAALGRARARMGIAVLALLLLLLCLSASLAVQPPSLAASADMGAAAAAPMSRDADLLLFEKTVAGMRSGAGDYYTVATDAMRAGGYPLRPFFTVRLPALATVQAALPSLGPPLLLLLLAAVTAAAWGLRLTEVLTRALPRLVAGMLLLGSMLAFLRAGLWPLHELWAGLLVALSLALRRPGRWVEPAALALAAMLIRETAALYAIVMAVMAWREGARTEARGWVAVLLLFVVALGAHAHAVTGATGPLDVAAPRGGGWLGIGFFVQAVALSTVLQLLPLWVGALLAGLALFGWASWADPLATRALALLLGYGALIALFARPDQFYWALMVAPLFFVGLVFVPDGARDLVIRALDKRRITVTRVSR